MLGQDAAQAIAQQRGPGAGLGEIVLQAEQSSLQRFKRVRVSFACDTSSIGLLHFVLPLRLTHRKISITMHAVCQNNWGQITVFAYTGLKIREGFLLE